LEYVVLPEHCTSTTSLESEIQYNAGAPSESIDNDEFVQTSAVADLVQKLEASVRLSNLVARRVSTDKLQCDTVKDTNVTSYEHLDSSSVVDKRLTPKQFRNRKRNKSLGLSCDRLANKSNSAVKSDVANFPIDLMMDSPIPDKIVSPVFKKSRTWKRKTEFFEKVSLREVSSTKSIGQSKLSDEISKSVCKQSSSLSTVILDQPSYKLSHKRERYDTMTLKSDLSGSIAKTGKTTFESTVTKSHKSKCKQTDGGNYKCSIQIQPNIEAHTARDRITPRKQYVNVDDMECSNLIQSQTDGPSPMYLETSHETLQFVELGDVSERSVHCSEGSVFCAKKNFIQHKWTINEARIESVVLNSFQEAIISNGSIEPQCALSNILQVGEVNNLTLCNGSVKICESLANSDGHKLFTDQTSTGSSVGGVNTVITSREVSSDTMHSMTSTDVTHSPFLLDACPTNEGKNNGDSSDHTPTPVSNLLLDTDNMAIHDRMSNQSTAVNNNLPIFKLADRPGNDQFLEPLNYCGTDSDACHGCATCDVIMGVQKNERRVKQKSKRKKRKGCVAASPMASGFHDTRIYKMASSQSFIDCNPQQMLPVMDDNQINTKNLHHGSFFGLNHYSLFPQWSAGNNNISRMTNIVGHTDVSVNQNRVKQKTRTVRRNKKLSEIITQKHNEPNNTMGDGLYDCLMFPPAAASRYVAPNCGITPSADISRQSPAQLASNNHEPRYPGDVSTGCIHPNHIAPIPATEVLPQQYFPGYIGNSSLITEGGPAFVSYVHYGGQYFPTNYTSDYVTKINDPFKYVVPNQLVSTNTNFLRGQVPTQFAPSCPVAVQQNASNRSSINYFNQTNQGNHNHNHGEKLSYNIQNTPAADVWVSTIPSNYVSVSQLTSESAMNDTQQLTDKRRDTPSSHTCRQKQNKVDNGLNLTMYSQKKTPVVSKVICHDKECVNRVYGVNDCCVSSTVADDDINNSVFNLSSLRKNPANTKAKNKAAEAPDGTFEKLSPSAVACSNTAMDMCVVKTYTAETEARIATSPVLVIGQQQLLQNANNITIENCRSIDISAEHHYEQSNDNLAVRAYSPETEGKGASHSSCSIGFGRSDSGRTAAESCPAFSAAAVGPVSCSGWAAESCPTSSAGAAVGSAVSCSDAVGRKQKRLESLINSLKPGPSKALLLGEAAASDQQGAETAVVAAITEDGDGVFLGIELLN